MTKYFSRGRKLLEFIEKKGWTKAEFARRMDIFPQNVTMYISGLRDPLNLASGLLREGCDLNWLCSEDGAPAVKEEAVIYSPDEEKEIGELADKMLKSMRLWLNHPPDDAIRREMRRIARKTAEEEIAKRKQKRS